MATVTELRKQIVAALEKGEPTEGLERQLKEARLVEQTSKEVSELQGIASKRQELKQRADSIVAKAKLQGEAIDAFLQARDAIIEPLQAIVKQARALPQLQEKCYAEFHDGLQAGWAVRATGGFLPEDFTYPMLDFADGVTPAYDAASRVFQFLSFGLGILSNLRKNERKPNLPVESEVV